MADILVPLNGHVRVRAWEKQPDGTEKEVYDKTIKNLIVDAGKSSILKYIGNITGGGYANSIGVGNSTTAASSVVKQIYSHQAVISIGNQYSYC